MWGADDLDILAKCISLSDQLSAWSLLTLLEVIYLMLEFSSVRALQWEARLDIEPQSIEVLSGRRFERKAEGSIRTIRLDQTENSLDENLINSIKGKLLTANSGDKKIVHDCLATPGGVVVYRGRLRGHSRVSGFFAEFNTDHAVHKAAEKAKGILWCIAPILGKALELHIASGASQQEALSSRQLDVLRCAALGNNAGEIGRLLRISERTVNFHLQNAYRKLGVANRSQALVRATKLGLLPIVAPAENLEVAMKTAPVEEET